MAPHTVGAVFNALNIRWNILRKKPFFTANVHPALEVMGIAFATLTTSWFLAPSTVHCINDAVATEYTMEEVLEASLAMHGQAFGEMICVQTSCHLHWE